MIAEPMTKIHVDEYEQLPETMQRVELIDGVIVEGIEMPAPSIQHQQIILRLASWLLSKLPQIGGKVSIAPTDVYLDEVNTVQPDILWIAEDGKAHIETKRVIGAPDFVAEVLSPSTSKVDRTTKFRLYEKFGVRELWFIDPEAHLIEVWALQDKKFQYLDGYGFDETIQSPLFGAVNAAEIFPA
jgi:Uma2 family endonuclease